MDSKTILVALAGFIAGGLLVSTAATTFDKANTQDAMNDPGSSMATLLQDKRGDDYDKAFIEQMIVHHEDAVEMAKLSASRAKHQEIKQLSNAIITAQEHEIQQMKNWQSQWK